MAEIEIELPNILAESHSQPFNDEIEKFSHIHQRLQLYLACYGIDPLFDLYNIVDQNSEIREMPAIIENFKISILHRLIIKLTNKNGAL